MKWVIIVGERATMRKSLMRLGGIPDDVRHQRSAAASTPSAFSSAIKMRSPRSKRSGTTSFVNARGADHLA